MDKVRLICRMCLQCNDLVDIFSDNVKKSGLWMRINIHLGQEVSEDDDLPEYICLQCIKVICDFDLYCIRVTENQDFLRKNFTVIQVKDVPEETAEKETKSSTNKSDSPVDDNNSEKTNEDMSEGDKNEVSQSSSVNLTTSDEIEQIYNLVEAEDSIDEYISSDGEKDIEKLHKYTDNPEQNIPEHVKSIIEQFPKTIMKNGKYTVHRMQLVDMVQNFYLLKCQLCHGKMARHRHKTIKGFFNHYRRWHKIPGYVTCCDRKFRKRTEIVYHMIWHVQPSAFRCSLCGKKVSDPTTLVGHMKCHEGKEGQQENEVRCDECGIKVQSEHFLEIHKNKIHKCAFELKEADINEPHPDFEGFPRTIMKNGEVAIRGIPLTKLVNKFYKFTCDLCSESERFINFSNLLQHYQTIHSTRGYATCCGIKIRKRMPLIHHMAQHLDPDAFKCSVCGKMCTRPGTLKDHMMTHKAMEERWYFCTKCPKRYVTHLGLEKHMISHQSVEERKKFPCSICGKTFYHKTSLKSHEKVAHGDENVICHVCGKKLKTVWSHRTHMITHNPEREKKQTKKPLKRSRKRPKETGKSTGRRPTLEEWRVCPYCSQIFDTKKLLLEHTRVEHNFLHKCEHCSYSNEKFELYFRHLNQQHLLERCYVCEICGASYEYSYKLKYHMNVHTREKKYTCQFCNKEYLSMSGFCRHGRDTHAEEYKLLKIQNKELRKTKNVELKEVTNTKVATETKDVTEANEGTVIIETKHPTEATQAVEVVAYNLDLSFFNTVQ